MMENINNTKKNSSDGLDIMDCIRIALSNWMWFVLSVAICVGLSYYKQKKMSDIYYRYATILVKDQSNGSRSAAPSSAFTDIGALQLMQSPIENELLIFKSKRLMEEVVKRLNLDIYYSTAGKFRDWDLYHESPVQLSFPDAKANASFSMNVTPLSQKEVLLYQFSTASGSNQQVKALLNDTVVTPIGKVVVTPSLFYSRECFGKVFHVAKANREGVANRYSGSLQVDVMRNGAKMIKLGITDVSPRRAEDILNVLIDVYNQDAVNDKNRMAVSTAEFINERLIIIERELGGFESQIAAYKSKNRVADIASQTGTYVETTSQYQQEVMNMENQLALIQYVKDCLVDPAKFDEFIPSNIGIADVNIETFITEYNTLLLRRDKLLANSSTKNPVIQELNKSLSILKQNMIRTVDNLMNAMEMKIANVRGEEERIQKRISAVPGQQRYMLSVERQQKIKESLYIYLLNKREENALAQSMVESNVRVIDPAKGSNAPVAPNRQNILLMGLMVGLAIPAGIIVLMILLDNKVRTKKDLKKALSVPYLGDIPEHKRGRGESKHAIVVKQDGEDPVTEAFRILRTNMAFMDTKETPIKCIMVTSLAVNAGKTFISSNLGMTIALAGKKVIIVDLDIRKGSLSYRMNRHKHGVTNYLSGNITDINEIITDSGLHENLSLMASGPIPPNPAELLLSHRLNELVAALKEKFDYVLLDNVPSNMVADALIVNRLADLTLYVIRSGQLDRKQLPEIEQLYTEGKLKNMAIVLNGVKMTKKGYGYYGYYGSYGYGYGKANKKKHA